MHAFLLEARLARRARRTVVAREAFTRRPAREGRSPAALSRAFRLAVRLFQQQRHVAAASLASAAAMSIAGTFCSRS
jgi:hypothetical protein